MKKNKKAQNVLEYILIFAMVAAGGYAFVTKFDFKTLRNYDFMRPVDSSDTTNGTKIRIEPMTGNGSGT